MILMMSPSTKRKGREKKRGQNDSDDESPKKKERKAGNVNFFDNITTSNELSNDPFDTKKEPPPYSVQCLYMSFRTGTVI